MKLTILSQSVTVSEPYQAGHQLTADEAEYLNLLRARTVLGNLRRRLTAALRGGQPLQPIIDHYDAEFEICKSKLPAPLVEQCAMEVAKRQFPTATRHQLFEHAQTLLDTSEVQELARTRFANRRKFAQQALEEIL